MKTTASYPVEGYDVWMSSVDGLVIDDNLADGSFVEVSLDGQPQPWDGESIRLRRFADAWDAMNRDGYAL